MYVCVYLCGGFVAVAIGVAVYQVCLYRYMCVCVVFGVWRGGEGGVFWLL